MQGLSRKLQMKVNYGGTVNVISVAQANHVSNLVYTSSASVVSNGKDQAGIDESLPYPSEPFDSYNETKAMAERDVLQANGNGGLATTSLRVAGLFGYVPLFPSLFIFLTFMQSGRQARRTRIDDSTHH